LNILKYNNLLITIILYQAGVSGDDNRYDDDIQDDDDNEDGDDSFIVSDNETLEYNSDDSFNEEEDFVQPRVSIIFSNSNIGW
jgi:hypothetical protein